MSISGSMESQAEDEIASLKGCWLSLQRRESVNHRQTKIEKCGWIDRIFSTLSVFSPLINLSDVSRSMCPCDLVR